MNKMPLLCALVAIPCFLSSQRSGSHEAPGPSDARYVTIDFDRDGRVDYFVIEPGGRGRLLVRADDGTFQDRTEAVGLEALGPVGRAYWKDLTGDRWPDLVVVSPDGRVRLFVGDGTSFEDQSPALAAAGGTVVNAIAFDDYDLNGWYDLELWTAAGGTLLVLNRGDLVFELGQSAWLGGRVLPVDLAPLPSTAPGPAPLVVSGGPGTSALGPGVCADQLINQETGGCLEASTVPALGRLYPLGPELFVAASTGHVGINTTTPDPTPGVVLHVNGSTRVSGDLRISGTGNKIMFPDGSVQTTAMAVGPTGADGAQGPQGDPGTMLPAGTILMWGSPTPPDDQEFVLCDGGEYPVAMYPQLAVALGNTYGGTPGVTFRVPDMTQRFPMGAASSPSYMLGDEGGSLDHAHGVVSHQHTVPGHGHGYSLSVTGSGNHTHAPTGLSIGTTGSTHTHAVTGGISPDGSHTHGIKFKDTGPTSGGAKKLPESPLSNWDGIDGDIVQPDGTHTHPHTLGTNTSGSTHTHNIAGQINSSGSHAHGISGTVGSGASGDSNFSTLLDGASTTTGNNPPYLTVYFIIKT